MSRRLLAFAALGALLPACGGSDGASAPALVVIQSITAAPAVLRPGEDADLEVHADDSTGGTLTYAWSAPSGFLSSTTTNPATWTAPGVGSYLIHVTVTGSGGATATGAVSLLVSVSPSGPLITSVNPAPTRPGRTLRITGAGFGATQGTSTIAVTGSLAAVTSWTDSSIDVTTPNGALMTGDVQAFIGGVGSSPFPIDVLWAEDDAVNVGLSTAVEGQFNVQACGDGAGGAIAVWQDNSGSLSLRAQRVNQVGIPLWAANGVTLTSFAGLQGACAIVSDGAGGAIIAWQESTNIRAQRISPTGAPLWAGVGVSVCAAANTQDNCRIVTDGSAGAIIAWEDGRSGLGKDIYAQRLNDLGAPQWTADGVAVSTIGNDQAGLSMAPDGAGGALLAWEDLRSGATLDIYAQRLNAAGASLWTAGGAAVCAAVMTQQICQITTDGAGGAIIAWEDLRNGTNLDVFAQRMSAAGAPQWLVDGVPLALENLAQANCQIVSDGAGGAIVAWQDLRNTFNFDLYAERLDATGVSVWGGSNKIIAGVPGHQLNCRMTSDGAGGAILAWEDLRDGTIDLYAQRISAAGTVYWEANGVPVSRALGTQTNGRVVSDGVGGAIVAWQDFRNEANLNVYAQGIRADGRR